MAMSIGAKGAQANINMTPMIDVLLVLIIIFMVITPTTSRGLDTLLPQAPSADAERAAPPEDIVVTVRGDGTALLDQETLSLPALRERLASLFGTRPRNVVFVRGGKDLEFARVAEVIDLIHGAGVDRVALMTD